MPFFQPKLSASKQRRARWLTVVEVVSVTTGRFASYLSTPLTPVMVTTGLRAASWIFFSRTESCRALCFQKGIASFYLFISRCPLCPPPFILSTLPLFVIAIIGLPALILQRTREGRASMLSLTRCGRHRPRASNHQAHLSGIARRPDPNSISNEVR